MIFATARIAPNSIDDYRLLFIQADEKEFTITTRLTLYEDVELILSSFNLERISDWQQDGAAQVCRVKRK